LDFFSDANGINPQAFGLRPGRGAKILKPANESLRAFCLG